MKRVGMRALKWPFSRSEVDRRIARLQGFKGTINLALVTDYAYDLAAAYYSEETNY